MIINSVPIIVSLGERKNRKMCETPQKNLRVPGFWFIPLSDIFDSERSE